MCLHVCTVQSNTWSTVGLLVHSGKRLRKPLCAAVRIAKPSLRAGGELQRWLPAARCAPLPASDFCALFRCLLLHVYRFCAAAAGHANCPDLKPPHSALT